MGLKKDFRKVGGGIKKAAQAVEKDAVKTGKAVGRAAKKTVASGK